MRRLETLALPILVAPLFAGTVRAGVMNLPMPSDYAADYAGIVSAPEKAQLKGLLQELERKTGAQVIVLSVKSLEDKPIETVSLHLAHDVWKLGQEGKDNGVLILIAPSERKYRIKEAWAEVDVVIERRFDLIPNLVETVKGYAAHEKGAFEHLADARTQYQKAQTVSDKAGVAAIFDKALVNVLAVAENYPRLRANETFLKLQDSLEGAENRIAVQRMRHNGAVQALNTYYRSFFGGFFCRRAHAQMTEFHTAPEVKKEVPKVKF